MEPKAVQPEAIPAKLRELAAVIRNDPTARDAIAEGFELIAHVMEPCMDCGQVEGGAL